MIMIGDLPPVWIPPKPAIIRPATNDEVKRGLIVGYKRASGPVTTTFANSVTSSTNATSYDLSISGMATVGSRIIGICARKAGSFASVSAISLDGATASPLGTPWGGNDGSGGSTVGLFVAPATANTTGTLSVTFNMQVLRFAAGVWNVLNLASTTPTAAPGGTTSSSVSINVVDGGAIFGVVYNGSNQNGFSWTGLTEAYDVIPEANHRASGANLDFATAQTGFNVGVSSFGSGGLLVVAVR